MATDRPERWSAIRGTRVAAAILASAMLVVACGESGGTAPAQGDSATPSVEPDATFPLGVVPPDSMSLAINNGSTLTVSLVVNGSVIASVDPATCLGCSEDDAVPASLLPPLPWQAEVRSPTGRVLVALTVHAGDVDYESHSSKGDANRVDLSCGRIDIWSGPPLLGPAPGPGESGDCRP
ncbi:MAG: hypothetical protein ACRDGI_10100 [Candidatus Limnocylindrales bacterium]